MVIVEDCQFYTTQKDNQEWRLLNVRGVDNGDREFPICACITKSNGYELEIDTYAWALEQYKQLLEDYEIPEPSFMLTDTGYNFVQAANEVCPNVHVQVVAERRIQEIQDHADDIIEDRTERIMAMEMWTHRVTTGGDVKKLDFKGSPEIKSLFTMLQEEEEFNFLPMSDDYPFFLQEMDFYAYQFMKEDDPDNVFEIVRFILKGGDGA